VFSPKTGQRKLLNRGGYAPRYVPSGHLLCISQDVLFAAPMDPARLELTGPPAPILYTVSSDPRRAGNALMQVAGNGLLLWRPRVETAARELAWLDAAGKLERVPGSATPFGYRSLLLSPEGRRVAAFRPRAGLGVFDLDRGVWSPLTRDANDVGKAVWSRQGQHLFVRGLTNDVVSCVRADGGGEPLPLGGERLFAIGVSGDGATLFVQGEGGGLFSMALDWADPQRPKAGKPEPFGSLKAMRSARAISPDGRWIAGNGQVAAGHDAIFVRSLGGDGIWQVSRDAGTNPAWSSNGRELFYRDEQGPGGRVFVVPYTAEGGVFRAGAARLWGTLPSRSGFDVSADGKRLLVTVAPEGAAEEKPTNQLQMRINFLEELKRRVPAGR
jgi:serine/threonine-protein kinase